MLFCRKNVGNGILYAEIAGNTRFLKRKTVNLFDPIQSNSLQKTSENWRFRGFYFVWMIIEVKRNQVRLRYLSEKLSE